MKFKIKNEQKKEKAPEIELELREDGEIVKLIGQNKDGLKKILMCFENGRFERITSADLDGLETDSAGKIVEQP